MNIEIYPLDYPLETDTSGFELEDAVTTLRVQARDTAIRQAHTRRISGQNSSSNQSRLCGSKPFPMPLTQRGQKQQPLQTLLGRHCFTAGGRGYAGNMRTALAFYFDTETNTAIGLFVSVVRSYMATLSTLTSGFFCGGGHYLLYTLMEELTYAKPSVAAIGATLSQARLGPVGFGNSVVGVIAGGMIITGATVRTTGEFTYATKTNVSLGDRLVEARMAPHNGAALATTGFIFGGTSQPWTLTNFKLNSEAYTFGSKTFAIVAANLSHPHQSHACFASRLRAYICGGFTAAWAFSNVITGFTFSGQTNAPLSAVIPSGDKVCCDGTGSSLNGYILGGDAAASFFSGLKSIDRLNYGTETTAVLGMQLVQSIADNGAVQDYLPSLV